MVLMYKYIKWTTSPKCFTYQIKVEIPVYLYLKLYLYFQILIKENNDFFQFKNDYSQVIFLCQKNPIAFHDIIFLFVFYCELETSLI